MLKTDSLQAYWRFEKPENFSDFDGSGDYITVTDDADYHFGSSDFTIGAWVYLDETTGAAQRSIAGVGGGSADWGTSGHEVILFIYSDGKLYLQYAQSGYHSIISTSTVSISYGWHYITSSRISSTITLYIDGESVGSGSITGAVTEITSGTPRLRIGSTSSSDAFWNGLIRNVRLYKGTGLTQTQIQDVMQSERLAPTANLVGYWQMDEGTGTNVVDDSSNSNDGTISGASWTTRVQDASNNWYPITLTTSVISTSGKFGSTFSQDASNKGLATVPGGITLENDLTISCWVKATDDYHSSLFCYGDKDDFGSDAFMFEINNAGGDYSVGVTGYNSSIGNYAAYSYSNAITINVYAHVVYTRSGVGDTHKIYVNGVENLQNSSAVHIFASTTEASTIGAPKNIYGSIDELMVFNKALGLTDVKRLMMGLHPLVK